MRKPLVSIIMPAYNAERFIQEAIVSVINQSYTSWELIVVNDGSKDNTEKIAKSFFDRRIILISQENKGVAAARNVGLLNMQGDFFCFLDADDVLPRNSLEDRINLMLENPEFFFVEGQIITMDENLQHVIRIYLPSFRGKPKKELAKLTGSCYFGVTWLIRRVKGYKYQFPEYQTHGEDLRFFLEIADHGFYSFTENPVYIYRKHPASAMNNLEGLMRGYMLTLQNIKSQKILTFFEFKILKFRFGKIMLFSFLQKKKLFKGFKAFWLFLTKK